MIVNFPVADRYHTALRVHNRLVGLIVQTTNGQPSRAEDRGLDGHLAGGIRAAVGQGPKHCRHSEMGGFGRR